MATSQKIRPIDEVKEGVYINRIEDERGDKDTTSAADQPLKDSSFAQDLTDVRGCLQDIAHTLRNLEFHELVVPEQPPIPTLITKWNVWIQCDMTIKKPDLEKETRNQFFQRDLHEVYRVDADGNRIPTTEPCTMVPWTEPEIEQTLDVGKIEPTDTNKKEAVGKEGKLFSETVLNLQDDSLNTETEKTVTEAVEKKEAELLERVLPLQEDSLNTDTEKTEAGSMEKEEQRLSERIVAQQQDKFNTDTNNFVTETVTKEEEQLLERALALQNASLKSEQAVKEAVDEKIAVEYFSGSFVESSLSIETTLSGVPEVELDTEAVTKNLENDLDEESKEYVCTFEVCGEVQPGGLESSLDLSKDLGIHSEQAILSEVSPAELSILCQKVPGLNKRDDNIVRNVDDEGIFETCLFKPEISSDPYLTEEDDLFQSSDVDAVEGYESIGYDPANSYEGYEAVDGYDDRVHRIRNKSSQSEIYENMAMGKDQTMKESKIEDERLVSIMESSQVESADPPVVPAKHKMILSNQNKKEEEIVVAVHLEQGILTGVVMSDAPPIDETTELIEPGDLLPQTSSAIESSILDENVYVTETPIVKKGRNHPVEIIEISTDGKTWYRSGEISITDKISNVIVNGADVGENDQINHKKYNRQTTSSSYEQVQPRTSPDKTEVDIESEEDEDEKEKVTETNNVDLYGALVTSQRPRGRLVRGIEFEEEELDSLQNDLKSKGKPSLLAADSIESDVSVEDINIHNEKNEAYEAMTPQILESQESLGKEKSVNLRGETQEYEAVIPLNSEKTIESSKDNLIDDIKTKEDSKFQVTEDLYDFDLETENSGDYIDTIVIGQINDIQKNNTEKVDAYENTEFQETASSLKKEEEHLSNSDFETKSSSNYVESIVIGQTNELKENYTEENQAYENTEFQPNEEEVHLDTNNSNDYIDSIVIGQIDETKETIIEEVETYEDIMPQILVETITASELNQMATLTPKQIISYSRVDELLARSPRSMKKIAAEEEAEAKDQERTLESIAQEADAFLESENLAEIIKGVRNVNASTILPQATEDNQPSITKPDIRVITAKGSFNDDAIDVESETTQHNLRLSAEKEANAALQIQTPRQVLKYSRTVSEEEIEAADSDKTLESISREADIILKSGTISNIVSALRKMKISRGPEDDVYGEGQDTFAGIAEALSHIEFEESEVGKVLALVEEIESLQERGPERRRGESLPTPFMVRKLKPIVETRDEDIDDEKMSGLSERIENLLAPKAKHEHYSSLDNIRQQFLAPIAMTETLHEYDVLDDDEEEDEEEEELETETEVSRSKSEDEEEELETEMEV